ncbi:MAG: anaerobic ribonucleoside-triphosphate reductase activating protein [Candidatus Nealsonbacteria bacterium]|nr:anaerobic ribonucleoside-triphosphate reductase activating protein [Candidatus Nealsonbacteria bacterium]
MREIEIGGLQKTTLIDYPGKIACTVFLIGCNFRCPWCYSAELVLPGKIKKQPRISEKEFFTFLKEKKGLLEGVAICGGEPCINKKLPDFIKKIKKLGYLIKLDTNGSDPAMLLKLINEKLVDYVAMDIKAPINAKMQNVKCKMQNDRLKIKNRYEQVVGAKVNMGKIKKSIEIIKNSDVDYEFRTTVVPVLHTKEDVIQMAKDISPAKRYFLQNFRPEKTIDPEYEKCRSFNQEELKSIQKGCNKYVLTKLRGALFLK